MNLLFLLCLLFLAHGHNLSNAHSSFSLPCSLSHTPSCTFLMPVSTSHATFLFLCTLSCDFVLTLYHTLTLLHMLYFSPAMSFFPAHSYSHALSLSLFLSFPLLPFHLSFFPSFYPPFNHPEHAHSFSHAGAPAPCLMPLLSSQLDTLSCNPVLFLTYPCLDSYRSFFLCFLTSFVPCLSFFQTP